MLTKLAGIVLAGSLVTLSAAGVLGLVNPEFRHWSNQRDHVRVEVRKHREQVRHRVRAEVQAQVREQVAHARAEGWDRGEYAEVAGRYVFDAGGNPMGKFPWSAHVEIELQPQGRYALRVKTNFDNEMQEETSWGRYRLRGDRVVVYSGHDDDRFEFIRQGNKLMFDAAWAQKLALKAVGVENAHMTRVE